MIPDTSIPGIYIATGRSSWNLVIHTLYQVSSVGHHRNGNVPA